MLSENDAINAADLPRPTGYRMLVKPYEIKPVSKGGIIIADESKAYADEACLVAQVVAMGDDCYKASKFNAPWCAVGDYIIYNRHVGQRIEIKRGDGVERYLIINDDDVRATVKTPATIRMYL